MDGESETIKKSLLRSSMSGVCLTSLPKVGLNSLSKVGLTDPNPSTTPYSQNKYRDEDRDLLLGHDVV